jgi:hypothetical protein
MLLDPFEEQFDLPAAFVERADGRGRQPELVGEEHQRSARFGVPQAAHHDMKALLKISEFSGTIR